MYNNCAVYTPPNQSSGGTGTGFTAVVANYSALPSAASASGEFYYVENAQGTSWVPAWLGGSYYPPGTYYSTGSSWITGISPYQATLADVNTGTITDQFVSPYTFTNASKWTTKQDALSGTGLVYSTAGTISYYTTTGSGTVAALQTSPVFVTNITTPAILGGTAVGSYVDIIGTSGNGTTTSAGITFRVGNNGGTTAGTIYHSGQLRYGTTTAPGGSLAIPVRIGSGTNTIDIGSYSASFAAIWFNQATPSTSNFGFLGNSTTTYLNGTSNVYFTINGTGKVTVSSTGMRVGDSTNPSVPLHVVGTGGEPFRAGYDNSNYFRLLVGSAGEVVFDSVGTSAGFTFSDSVNINSSLQCDSIVNDTGLAAGTYTPTLTNTTNISASTAYECQYLRVGNTITVSGKVDIDATAPGLIELGISLPVASNFATEQDCAGVGVSVVSGEDAAWIKADTTNDRALLSQNKSDTTNHSHYFTFTYQVI